MANFEQKDMSGVLFKNDRKEKDTHPDYKGSACLHGEQFWVSGWIKQTAKGPLMSLAFKPRDVQQPKTDSRITSGARVHEPLDDEIPF